MTIANSFDKFDAQPIQSATGLQITHTPWGMILKEARLSNNRVVEQIASAMVGGAFIMVALMMFFSTGLDSQFAMTEVKLALTGLFGIIGALLIRFSLDSGAIKTEVDLERRVIRICKVTPKRKVVDQIFIGQMADILVVQTPEGAGLAIERAHGARADLLAVGTQYQIAMIHQRISDAMPETHV
ncbi:hypothetical protein [Nereida sp. MMG025]|uniref:hypothetical protein n=1 Tax=Nereida sp. MMG025 TaxID=2909981 RepID=UPI001F2171E8|nr:hypothetical protein [Nereida sp. MMG025]MCF6443373.1 hypothetical protein [Nereida sp. MMG025]